ncbi:Replication protein A DNA-binding subunit [Liparis tanakae]|uniref:Replication protein A DNA-binding subunit n=1 Tax=Liparis tanakae TaxID=230148 RepID=A0A4Z2GAY0_9TELE|nr:Replication protein A DNA-binding subunit [Liparis tanakae]
MLSLKLFLLMNSLSLLMDLGTRTEGRGFLVRLRTEALFLGIQQGYARFVKEVIAERERSSGLLQLLSGEKLNAGIIESCVPAVVLPNQSAAVNAEGSERACTLKAKESLLSFPRFDRGGKAIDGQSLTRSAGSGSKRNWKTLSDVKSEQLGQGEKPSSAPICPSRAECDEAGNAGGEHESGVLSGRGEGEGALAVANGRKSHN